MSPVIITRTRTSFKYIIGSCCHRYLSSSFEFQYTKLSNFEATKLINALKVKHKNNHKHIDNTIKESFEIYERVNKNEIDNYLINALLRLWWDYRNASQIFKIWPDIELYHQQNNYMEIQLSYSSVMKCLLFPNDIDISKCIQTLQWMERCRYSLTIHDAFLNKLILNCGKHKNIEGIKYIDKLMKSNLIETKQRILGNNTALITAYGVCGNVSDAIKVFNSISDDIKDIVMIGAMMKVYVDNHFYSETLQLYDKYDSIHNHITHIMALKAVVNVHDFEKGLKIKESISENDYNNIRIQTALIDFYGFFREIEYALDIFAAIDITQLNAVCVGCIMKALIDNGLNEEALNIYDQQMLTHSNINNVVQLLALKASRNANKLEKGILIHESLNLYDSVDALLVSACIDFYGKFGQIEQAEKIFNTLQDKDKSVGIIDCMMTVYINNGGNKQALYLYDKFNQLHDNISHVLAFKACINANDFDKGLQIHAQLKQIDIFINTVLIDFYGKFGHIQSALEIFNSIPNNQKTIVVINALMQAHIHCDLNHEAINLFQKLYEYECSDYNHIKADIVSYKTIFKACNNAMFIQFGHELHTKLLEDKQNENILKDAEIATHLINMYGQSGLIEECESVFTSFDDCNSINVSLYKAMLNVYGMVGDIDKAMDLYHKMSAQHIDTGIYIRLLKCCAAVGDMDMAQHIWSDLLDAAIKCDEFIMGAYIDCMARKGLLQNALTFMKDYDYKYESGWLSLMSSCRKYRNMELGETVYNEINTLFETNINAMSCASALMSHLYVSQLEFDKQSEIRNNMQRNGWIPKQGKTEIYVDGTLHVFQSGAGIDDIYFNNKEVELYRMIDAKLDELCVELRHKYGFKHDYTMLTRKCDDDNIRNNELKRHGEKQALVYGLLCISEENPIIIKNSMRICNDCHDFMKSVSHLTNRKITIADPNRVHVFVNGCCSCNDFY